VGEGQGSPAWPERAATVSRRHIARNQNAGLTKSHHALRRERRSFFTAGEKLVEIIVATTFNSQRQKIRDSCCQNRKFVLPLSMLTEFALALSQRRQEEAGVLFDTLNPQPKRAKRSREEFFLFLLA
jgi:hypothetical protein